MTTSKRILERGQGSPAEVLSQAIITARGKSIRPKTLGQKAYVDAIDQQHDRVRHRPGRNRQDLPRDGEGRAGPAAQRGRAHHPEPAGDRGGGAARVPARNAHRQDRPLPAPALRRAQRDDGPRARAEAARGRHRRGRPARLHARPHAQQRVRRARRGPEHDARADEDVPHPARLRHQDGRHRRHHPDRPARGLERPAARDARARRHRRHRVRAPHERRRRAPHPRRPHRRRLHEVRRREAGEGVREGAAVRREPRRSVAATRRRTTARRGPIAHDGGADACRSS